MSTKLKKKKAFCFLFVSSYVSLYQPHHYSGEQSHIWKKKKKIIWILKNPEESVQNPEVRSKPAPCALQLAAYLVNISTSSSLSKHVNGYVHRYVLQTRRPSRDWDLTICFPLFPVSLFRATAHNLSGINDGVNKMRLVCGWICLAGLVPVLPRDKPTAGLIYLPQPHPAVLCTGHTTSQLVTG